VFTEPLAAAFEILEQMCVEPCTEAMVLGDIVSEIRNTP
jgi:hypothetical protein